MKIGIIGSGHIGRALAKNLVENYDISLSYSGKESTLKELKKLDLDKHIETNEEISKNREIIFLCVKPQDYRFIKDLDFSQNSTIVSVMAGISIKAIRELVKIEVIRTMPSVPDTIHNRDGIVAMYPVHEEIEKLFIKMGLKPILLDSEDKFRAFTVLCGCLPALIYSQEIRKDKDYPKILFEFARKNNLPDFERVFNWHKGILPTLSLDKINEIIDEMATKGGVTEAIMQKYFSGKGLGESINAGFERIQQLEIQA